MSRVYIVVEGQTEEAFVNDVLGPILHPQGVYPYPCLIGRPGHKGGRVSYERAKRDVTLFLKQDQTAFCTTMFDFYGLGPGFPGKSPPGNLPGAQQVAGIEAAIKADLLATLPAALGVEARFLPYLQLHEYEGLLFSDPEAFARGIYEPNLIPIFKRIRDEFPTPEDINDDPDTAPSKRVVAAHPAYRKPLYGALAALAVGIETMRRECPRFNQWVGRLETLAIKGSF
jgi:hypothetical protein